VREFCTRWNYPALFSACRIQYASLLLTRGEWAEAEREIEALSRSVETAQPRLVPVARARMGELRRLQGRHGEAARLLAEGGTHLLAVLARAALALDQGDFAAAAEHAEEYLRRVPTVSRTERVHGLKTLALARAAQGDPDAAEPALDELRAVAVTVGTDPLRAVVAAVEGAMLRARRRHADAAARFQDAIDLMERSRTPYDAARARASLATVLKALGRTEPAAMEARIARAEFARLGAAADEAVAARLLTDIEASAARAAAGRRSLADAKLTAREVEVLRLVADGMSDREIAARLDLSEHTVHRHITNVLTKTGLPSRAAAVAYAARAGLL
jgi:DNA-binding CsgD family transcriptional regulator